MASGRSIDCCDEQRPQAELKPAAFAFRRFGFGGSASIAALSDGAAARASNVGQPRCLNCVCSTESEVVKCAQGSSLVLF